MVGMESNSRMIRSKPGVPLSDQVEREMVPADSAAGRNRHKPAPKRQKIQAPDYSSRCRERLGQLAIALPLVPPVLNLRRPVLFNVASTSMLLNSRSNNDKDCIRCGCKLSQRTDAEIWLNVCNYGGSSYIALRIYALRIDAHVRQVVRNKQIRT